MVTSKSDEGWSWVMELLVISTTGMQCTRCLAQSSWPIDAQHHVQPAVVIGPKHHD